MPYDIKFVDEKNKELYKEAVLSWLEDDYNEKNQPSSHFWHNRSIIEKSFNACKAMVALNKQEVIGYMIWNFHGNIRAEIDIVEVKEKYQQKGIFKEMLKVFSAKHIELVVFSVLAIPESHKVFDKMGWKIVDSNYRQSQLSNNKIYIKLIKPILSELNDLSLGRVIAVCSKDFYAVKADPEKFKNQMKYFQIDLNEDASLRQPIVTDFHYEGYVGVYFDKNLIVQGKAKHLFEYDAYNVDFNLLIIQKFLPLNLKLFSESGFLLTDSQKLEEITTIDQVVVDTKIDNEPPLKRQRIEGNRTVNDKENKDISLFHNKNSLSYIALQSSFMPPSKNQQFNDKSTANDKAGEQKDTSTTFQRK